MLLPMHQSLAERIARHIDAEHPDFGWTYKSLFAWLGHPYQYNNAIEAMTELGYLTQEWNTGKLALTDDGKAGLLPESIGHDAPGLIG